ncbi:hypothetical protein DSO57_1023362 [Entomophthora muscae]|uniref:Uncharacterized protein n=1 Tax=Entomophthora muscae TaxID=34485 RepID=A0ACC2S507_9FUNG|nr:hypothetical protein DSO57_1023362 [Entomophthora muscae]
MEPLVTPKPMPSSAAELPLDHTNKLFGIVYITLTGVIETIAPATSPRSWVSKSMSYLIKLAPILWWALPTQSANRQFPNASKLANQGWFPDKALLELAYNKLLIGCTFTHLQRHQAVAHGKVIPPPWASTLIPAKYLGTSTNLCFNNYQKIY